MAVLLGIDTGGTYTDAALYDDATGQVLAAGKALTTPEDLSIGVAGALDAVFSDKVRVEAAEVDLVSLSTTLATNALVEGRGAAIALVMIGQGREALGRAGLGTALGDDPALFINGGHTAAGEPLAPLDLDDLRRLAGALAPKVAGFAVAAHFATRNPAHEIAARDCLREVTGLPVSCSHELASRLDAPRRALTTLLNARLIPLLQRLILAVRNLMAARRLTAPLMVVKGDGSLISAETALLRPVETILSGPAASVVGARHLSGESDCLVVDMGGTTTDIALLRGGEPVLSAEGAMVGGWRTMVEAVAVRAHGLGGDSALSLHDGRLRLGPRRAVPLCLLEQTWPDILGLLERQLARAEARPDDGAFILRLNALETAGAGFTRAEATLWERLADGPLALTEIETSTLERRAAQRLQARGVAVLAGFTPSDAAHLLGLQAHWPGRVAALAAQLWMQRLGAAGLKRPETPEAFAGHVLEQVIRQSTAAVAEAALAEEKPSRPMAPGALLDRALEGPSLAPDSETLLDVALRLRRPLVAVGAPSATYYPAVAERLGTRAALPPHGEVCNAVGAVASGVIQRVRLTITQPDDERYRLHHADGVADFSSVEEAVAAAVDRAGQTARRRAEDAGAQNIELRIARQDRVVEGEGGRVIFIESEVLAVAVGRPGLGAGGLTGVGDLPLHARP